MTFPLGSTTYKSTSFSLGVIGSAVAAGILLGFLG